MQQSLQHFKRRNIVVTEPKQPFQITKPYCPRGKGVFSTEKKHHDSYLSESMHNPLTRSGTLKASLPIFDPRGGFQIRNETSFNYKQQDKLDMHFKSLYGNDFLESPNRETIKSVPYPDHFGVL